MEITSATSADDKTAVDFPEIAWNMKSFEWKLFHIILILSCIVLTPVLLVSTFIIIAYSNGQSMGCCSISKVISNPKHQFTVITTTTISAFLAFFISICRQIQISVKFNEFNLSQRWINGNKTAVCFNCGGYFSMILMAIFDSKNYKKIHTVFSTLAFFLCVIFAIFTTILTIKQRRIEYKKTKMCFFVDAILMFITTLLSTVFLLIYAIAFLNYKAIAASNGVEVTKASELLPDFYNISEWISFICLISTLFIFSFGFQHDNVDNELMKYFATFFHRK
eukprot:238509_1